MNITKLRTCLLRRLSAPTLAGVLLTVLLVAAAVAAGAPSASASSGVIASAWPSSSSVAVQVPVWGGGRYRVVNAATGAVKDPSDGGWYSIGSLDDPTMVALVSGDAVEVEWGATCRDQWSGNDRSSWMWHKERCAYPGY